MIEIHYYILNNKGSKIASFVNEFDRDCCFNTLQEEFPDCKFTKAFGDGA